MGIERHDIGDGAFWDQWAERDLKRLPRYVEVAAKDATKLWLLIGLAEPLVAACCASKSHSQDALAVASITADAYHSLFAVASSPTLPVNVSLGSHSATYASRPDQSSVHVGAWIRGHYFNVLCGDQSAIDQICRTPVELVRRSTTKGSEYHYLYMEALELFNKGEAPAPKAMMNALSATDPERKDVLDGDVALYLHVPQIEVLICLATRDPKFGDALARAVDNHKKYWSRTADRRNDPDGLISIPLTALAAYGRLAGLSFDVDSPYLALQLEQN